MNIYGVFCVPRVLGQWEEEAGDWVLVGHRLDKCSLTDAGQTSFTLLSCNHKFQFHSVFLCCCFITYCHQKSLICVRTTVQCTFNNAALISLISFLLHRSLNTLIVWAEEHQQVSDTHCENEENTKRTWEQKIRCHLTHGAQMTQSLQCNKWEISVIC